MEDMSRSIISVYKDNIVNNEGGAGNPHPDNNIILDYMNEKAKISNYSNQWLNDDSEQKRQINSIIDVLSDITNKLDIKNELTHLTCYNLGFSVGILS